MRTSPIRPSLRNGNRRSPRTDSEHECSERRGEKNGEDSREDRSAETGEPQAGDAARLPPAEGENPTAAEDRAADIQCEPSPRGGFRQRAAFVCELPRP